MQLEYYIDMDERGEFRADVRDESGATICQIDGEFFHDGFMKHKNDMRGLCDYLAELGLMRTSDRLINCG